MACHPTTLPAPAALAPEEWFAPGAEEFIARLALRPGESVLDVACGTGNLAIPAARAGACDAGPLGGVYWKQHVVIAPDP